MRWAFFVAILVSLGALAPAASAQEVTPVATPEVTTTISPSVILPQVIEAVHKADALCSRNCQLQDLFPLVHHDGTVDDHIVVFWPREFEGEFYLSPTDAMVGYDPSHSGLVLLDSGAHTVKWGLINTNGDRQELLDTLASPEMLPDPPPYRPDFCSVCGNEEFFPYVLPLGERIAFGFADERPDVTITDDIALFVWDDNELRLYYGPGTIVQLPSEHIWWEVGLAPEN